MIALDYGPSKDTELVSVFKLRIISGTAPGTEDRDKAREIGGRKPVYITDPLRKVDSLQHWEIPSIQVAEIVRLWKPEQIMTTPAADARLKRYESILLPINSLDPIPPSQLKWSIVPRRHQEFYVSRNALKNRLICMFYVGKGKTFAALERASNLGFNRTIVICPKKTITNWSSEVFAAYQNSLNVVPYKGTIKHRSKLKDNIGSSQIIITSFDLAKELSDVPYEQLIIDEAHLVCHPSTNTYKSVYSVVEKNWDSGLQLLTGTPINHKLPDLWALTNFCYPELAGTETSWIDRYIENKIGETKEGRSFVIHSGVKNEEDLQKRLDAIMVRLNEEDKEETFEDKQEIITVDLTERQRRLYNHIRDDILLELDNTTLPLQHTLARMTRLLQAAEGAFNIQDTWKDSGKFDYICQELDNTNERVVVWSRFKPISNLLYEKYKDRAVLFNGDLPPNRQDLSIWSFQGELNEFDQHNFDKYSRAIGGWPFKPGEAQFLFGVISPRSSLGINLHANCYRQIFSSFHWNGNSNMQAKGRLTRDGQKAPEVRTDWLVAVNTFEKRALSLILKNHQTTLEILEGKTGRKVKKLSELINILRVA